MGAACCAALLGLLAANARAFPDDAPAVYASVASNFKGSGNDTRMVTLGLVVPWTRWTPTLPWVPQNGNTWYWDFFLSQWRAEPLVGQDVSRTNRYTQFGAIATWRHRLGDGRSPWFFEAGLGGSLMNRLYLTPMVGFSTRFQFTPLLAFGRSFGAQGQQELSLRLQHFSNAGIKEPNPGENFLVLRYAYRF